MLKKGNMSGKVKRAVVKLIVYGIKASFLKSVFFAKLNSNPDFEFESTKLQYFFHSYNNFRLTCRCIEIPIIKYYLSNFPHENVLEIGNVTKHYYDDFKNSIKKIP